MWNLGETVLVTGMTWNGVIHLPFPLWFCGGSRGGDIKLSHQWLCIWACPPVPAGPVPVAIQLTAVPKPWSSTLSPSLPLGGESIRSRRVSLLAKPLTQAETFPKLTLKCFLVYRSSKETDSNGNLALGQREGAFVAAEIVVHPED